MELIINLLKNENYISSSDIVLIERTFMLLIALPIVTTIIGIFRHIIGTKSLNIFAPVILTFAFYEMGIIQLVSQSGDIEYTYNFFRGLKFGIAIYLIVIFSATLLHYVMRTFRMHYIPKSSIVLIGVSSIISVFIFFATILFEKKGLLYLDIFSIIMISTLSDTFVSIMSRKGLKYTFIVALQTLATSVIAYMLISIDFVRIFALKNTGIVVIILILINIYVGNFTGLRISEYWRFRTILLEENGSNVSNSKTNTKK